MKRQFASNFKKYKSNYPLLSKEELEAIDARCDALATEEFNDYFYGTLKAFYSKGIEVMKDEDSNSKGKEVIEDAKSNFNEFMELLKQESERRQKQKNYLEVFKRIMLSYSHLVVASKKLIENQDNELAEKIDFLFEYFLSDEIESNIIKITEILDDIFNLIT